MNRGERRARTEKVARRRFKQLENTFSPDFLPESEGFFKKANGFTNKKKNSREWDKIYRRRQGKLMDLRRNGAVKETEDVDS